MKSVQYCYTSPLAKKDILEIVSRENPGFMWSGIRGKVRGSCQIEVTYRSGSRNSWNPVFYGMLAERPEGAILTGEFRTHPYTIVFMWIWRSFVAVFFFMCLGAVLLPDQYVTGIGTPLFLLIPVGMLAFSFILEWAGETMGKGSQKEVLRFFETKLAAREWKKE